MSAIARYKGQTKKLRDIAINNLGVQTVSSMTDGDIDAYIENNFKIIWTDYYDGHNHASNDEDIILISTDVWELISDKVIHVLR